MKSVNQTGSTCKSVFKESGNLLSKERYTKIWIALINRLEKSKNENFKHRA